MRATVVPSEKTHDIQAALATVVAHRAMIYSDKDQIFLDVMNAFGMGDQRVVHSAKEFVRGELTATRLTASIQILPEDDGGPDRTATFFAVTQRVPKPKA